MQPIPAQLWVYRARVERVIDGDTLAIRLDQGLHTERVEQVRLLGVNTPEVKGASRPAGLAATAFVKRWLSDAGGDWPLVVQTEKSDAFGRFLATVWDAAGRCLNDDLLSAGHAVPFEG